MKSTRYRFKILAVSTLLLIVLLAQGFSDGNTVSGSGLEHTVSTTRSEKFDVDPREAAFYKWQQQELKAAVKAYFDKAIASGDLVGAGVSIVRGDSIVLSDGYGKRNIETDEGVDGKTIFRLGSLSKGFAGILAADLIQGGKLDWDDRVSDFIPEFQLGDARNSDQITLANLLSHTAGAPYHSFTNLVEAGLPLTDIAKRFKEVQPIGKPGAVYSYQNALFALSGEMMYKATGEEITTSLTKRFFEPLEMCTATMDYESLVHSENIAVPYSRWRNGWKPKKLKNNYYNAIAAGGISASAVDMGKWMRFILGHNPEVMNKSALEGAFRPVIEIKGRSKYYQRWPGHVSSYYGFGWRIHKFVEGDTDQERTIWHHGGSVNDYRNEIAVYPEADLGICVLVNSNSRVTRTVIPDLYKIVREVYQRTTSNSKLASHSNATYHEPL